MPEGLRLAAAKLERLAHVIALTHPQKQARNYVLSKLEEDDFGTAEGKEIKKRLESLYRTHGDAGFSLVEMREDAAISEEARAFLDIPKSKVQKAKQRGKAQIKSIVSKLHEWRKRRRFYYGTENLAKLGENFEDDTIGKAKIELEQLLYDLNTDRQKKVSHIGQRKREEVLRWLDKKTEPRDDVFIKTGLTHLDGLIGGFQRGDLVMLSAQRGGGKTAMLLQMALNQFRAGFNVAVASLEMQEEQLYDRAISNVTDTPFDQIRAKNLRKSDISKLKNQWTEFELGTDDTDTEDSQRENRFTLFDIKDVNYTPNNLDLEIGPGNYDIIFVDYLSLFGLGKHRELWTAQQEYSRQLKQIAGRRNCVVVVLTQLSKEERIKYGTAAEENADFWLWWRYGDEEAETGETQLQIGKARNAKRGIIPLKFRLKYMQVDTAGPAARGMSSYQDSPARKRKEDKKPNNDFDYNEEEDVFNALDDVMKERKSKPKKRKKKSKKASSKGKTKTGAKSPEKTTKKKATKKAKRKKADLDAEFEDAA